MLRWTRFLSTHSRTLRISPEVTQALQENVPVVALESTIITHGFPYPANLEMARAVERKIRDHGCVPATCAFLKGVPHVGLSDRQIENLAELKTANKVSRRDIGATMAQRLDGGTTIAGTMILSHMAGIDVFATGGLGGVHRDGHITMDVSADLTELSRTPVTVVCAGPKLILDIGRTMEFLETQGVFVGTYNDDGRARVEIPGFFCRSSGVKSPYSFSSWREMASIVHNQNRVMGLSSGSLVCVPPPSETALSSDLIDGIINNASMEALAQGVLGKELTPFLLAKIAAATGGQSVECNKQFVINNAEAACAIAKELGDLKTGSGPVNAVDTMVIGLVALDTICTLQQEPVMADSNPGKMAAGLGGVGFNVSLAHLYGLQNQGIKANLRFISAVGDDLPGTSIIKSLEERTHDVSGIKVYKDESSAQYTAMLSPLGELVMACADMKIFEKEHFATHVGKELARARPRVVVTDCNLLAASLDAVMAACQLMPSRPIVIVEPTSKPKLARLSQVNSANLRVFPNNTVLLITPTVAELEQIHASFSQREFFDDYDSWFPALDSLGIDAGFRDKLHALGLKFPALKDLLKTGTFQQAFQVLPYVPNILVKMGRYGCVLIKLSTNVNDYKSVPTTSKFRPTATLVSSGKPHDDNKRFGIVVEYFDIPHENKSIDIVNVTGAGDSFLGYLSASLLKENWLVPEIESLEQEWGKWEAVYKSQLASGKSLQSLSAISEKILEI
ncbi:hypothetical protein METBIDRAFT_78432 [Metschnikowia bicuspidata var. bicuspidata NRRL YB-4993]|uniref:Uncharacterized protein n=1 Tax=Metschnikowia bicuspidata var. bicuspidata NRRL YB-4993 TaxID=869754 RepID=A0A1A0HBU8_9ASCO|nr:hypothetical protein METBIDRAFT_78432 [Metschnikowia bicuspidata var. bicuspidata NRRL YB-4993]OBA21486.1 hypothetical protein METBIDRAFT_78432 [Metschnikowia bicuspidata var. bicuspidata NRRL YB-4993]